MQYNKLSVTCIAHDVANECIALDQAPEDHGRL
jgi:hypothetical protein